MFNDLEKLIREIYANKEVVPLHEPCFCGNEKKYLLDTIDSTFVSSVGKYVDLFEEKIKEFTGAKNAVAVVNGTNALHVALELLGVRHGDEVITQAFSFVATANAISYCGAKPVFLDVDEKTLGLSAKALGEFLNKNTHQEDNKCINNSTGNVISACVPVHMYGQICEMDEIVALCKKHNIVVVEDAAEAVGSFKKDTHAGCFGDVGILSFNGNKTITTGGGGMIITNNDDLANKAKHLTTTAKVAGGLEYFHDQIGYNYRMPNLNAALGVAQLENLPNILEQKQKIANKYLRFFCEKGYEFLKVQKGCKSNYWLNTVFLKSKRERDEFLEYFVSKKIMVRPCWVPLNGLPMYENCETDDLSVTKKVAFFAVNLPSGVVL